MASVLQLILKTSKQGTAAKDTAKDLGLLEKAAKSAAVAFIALGAAKVIKSAVLLAARVEVLGVVTKKLGQNVGMTVDEVRLLEKAIVDQGITLQGSRQAIAMMIQANVDLAHATDLARLAQDTAVIANLNSSEAFQQLTYVLQTGNVRMARTLGLNVQFGQAQQALAKSLGKTTQELTEQEVMQARTNAVMKAGTRISGTYEAAMETAGKQLLSMDRQIEEISRHFGNLFLPVLEEAVSILYEQSSAANESMELHAEFAAAQEYLGEATHEVNAALVEQGIITEGIWGWTDEYKLGLIELANELKTGVTHADELMLILAGIKPIVPELAPIPIENIESVYLQMIEDLETTAEKQRIGALDEALLRSRVELAEVPEDITSFNIKKDMEEAAIAAAQVSIAAGDTSTWGAAKQLAKDYGAVLSEDRDTAGEMYTHLLNLANLSPIEIEIITTGDGIPRQDGGPVKAGKPYVVGEREAELFVPRQDGDIYNQQQLAGGDININTGVSQRAFNNMAEDWMRGLGG
jgi:hypothetical protein